MVEWLHGGWVGVVAINEHLLVLFGHVVATNRAHFEHTFEVIVFMVVGLQIGGRVKGAIPSEAFRSHPGA